MGMEYKLRFTHPGPAVVIELLERLATFSRSANGNCTFELRDQENGDRMPDASLRVEPDGVYFCVYGGSGDRCLGEVVTRLVREFGAVIVTELE
jgi:hypothetical protein